MPEPLVIDGAGALSESEEGWAEETIPVYDRPAICSAEEWQVLRWTNKQRMKNGLEPLSTFGTLQAASDIRKRETAVKWSHTRPDGRSCTTALTDVGLSKKGAGENLAYASGSIYGIPGSWNPFDPEEIVEGWMDSTAHRKNILKGSYVHMGAGEMEEYSGSEMDTYWVQLFMGDCSGLRPGSLSVQNSSDVRNISRGVSLDTLGLTLEVSCGHGDCYLPVIEEMCSGYDANAVGAVQTVKVRYRGGETSFRVRIATSASPIQYRASGAEDDWRGTAEDGAMSGTVGEGRALERISIWLPEQPAEGSVEYRSYVQQDGWQDWVVDGAGSGTLGESKRLEAVQIRLTGKMAERYDVYYRVHVQTYGWMGWAKNGEKAGTTGHNKRMEAIEICLAEKGGAAPGSTADPFRQGPAGEIPPQTGAVNYQTHVQTYGWQTWVSDGAMNGTSGQSKRMEAVKIRLGDTIDGGICYSSHIQTYGWEYYWNYNGGLSGTVGQAKRLEAIRMELTGAAAEQYDVYYRVHVQTYGWLDWAKNGAPAGTEGLSRRMEGIEIRLVSKGEAAPGNTDRPFIKR